MITPMNSLNFLSRKTIVACCTWLSIGLAHAAAVVPSQTPLANIDRALANVVLTISAEFPTADTASYGAVGSAGNPDTTLYKDYPTVIYYGYFDPAKCYTYVTATPVTDTNTYFQQAPCVSGITPKGNFLNWASMGVLDQFRQTMTGGLRLVDTNTTTILQRAYFDTLAGGGSPSYPGVSETGVNAGNINAPNRIATTLDAGNLGRTDGTAQVGQYIYKISGMGDKMLVKSGSTMSWGTSTAPQRALQDCPTLSTTMGGAVPATPMCYHIRIKVCESGKLETNCIPYGTNYKPQGLMQEYNQNMRFSAFGYLSDYTKTQDQQGGVLRARMKSIGPTYADPVNVANPNPNKEWDPSTGIFDPNPNPADATASSGLTLGNFSPALSNSGVINYLNKFGQPSNYPSTFSSLGYAYKYYDPFAEIYYDSIRYLRGLPASTQSMANAVSTKKSNFDGFPAIKYGGKGTADDPVVNACQQNFIIAVGDKNNQGCDSRFGGTPGSTCSSGSPPSDDTKNYSFPGSPLVVDTMDSGAVWLGALAYWAHTNDIRPDRAPQRSSTAIQDVTTFMVDVMENHNYDGLKKTQLWMAAKWGGFDKTLTDQTSTATKNDPNSVKTPGGPLSWDNKGLISGVASPNGVPDNWYRGSDPVTMKTGLTQAFQSIVKATDDGDGAAPATSGVSIATADKIYYASYVLTNGGIGALKACAFGRPLTGATGCDAKPDWNAADWLNPLASKPVITTSTATYLSNTDRQIITRADSGGVKFDYDNLNTTEQNLLDIDPTTKVSDPSSAKRGAKRVDYLRGDSLNEIGYTGTGTPTIGPVFRQRATTKLGDLIGSGAVYVGAPNALYGGPLFPNYAKFVSDNKGRTPTLYVGANDGMLHAFDVNSKGKEVFAYVPKHFLTADAVTNSAKINSLTMPTYKHQFYVDATPMVGDVQITSGVWKTMLVGAYGAGGKGYFALDVTDPTNFTTAMNAQSNAASISMWEISDSHLSYPDMGYSYNQPSVSSKSSQVLQYALIPDKDDATCKAPPHQVIIVGNGFGSATGKAVLYFIEPSDGSLYSSVVLDAGPDNGLATPLPADTKTLGLVDTVWAGDLKGTMWRVRWDCPSKTWVKQALFNAGATKPITAAPAVTPHPYVADAWAVNFGTGKYIERSDYNTTTQQTLYGVVDDFSVKSPSTTAVVSLSDLVQQTVSAETTPDTTKPLDKERTQSSNAVDFSTKKGWYFDMPTTNGERMTVNPVLPPNTGLVLMSSFTPASACLAATGYVNVLNAFTGAKFVQVNADGSTTDKLSTVGIGMGIPFFSSVVSSRGQVVVKFGGIRTGASIDPGTTDPVHEITVLTPSVKGTRYSWREIR